MMPSEKRDCTMVLQSSKTVLATGEALAISEIKFKSVIGSIKLVLYVIFVCDDCGGLLLRGNEWCNSRLCDRNKLLHLCNDALERGQTGWRRIGFISLPCLRPGLVNLPYRRPDFIQCRSDGRRNGSNLCAILIF